MFGRSKKVASLKETIRVLEFNLERSRRERAQAFGKGFDKGRALFGTAIAEAHSEGIRVGEQKAAERDPLHQHNFADLEARIWADIVRNPERYPGNITGRWCGQGPQLQNIPRNPNPVLVNVSFEYKGVRTTFAVSDNVRTLLVIESEDSKKLRIVCHKFDGSRTQYDYETARITSEIRKEFK